MDGFLDSFPAQVAILDQHGVILDVNRAWTRFAETNGYAGPTFVGQNYLSLCDGVSGVERGVAMTVAEGFRTLARGGQSWFEQVYACHSPDEKRWFKLLMSRHDDNTLIMTHVNITTEFLSRSFLAHQGFLANTVHDLRTPINAVRAYAEMIERGIGRDRAHEFARNIVAAADITLELINDLLGASEAENGTLLLSEAATDLCEVVRESLVHVQHLADDRSVTLTLGFDPLPNLHADPRRLRQVLINLLSNAVKYNRTGGHVTVMARRGTDGGIVLTIADSGHGMSTSDIDRALQPFGRTLTALASGAEGTGLGLPFANHLITLHDGRMTIESTPRVGTTVTIAFPRWRSLATDTVARDAASAGPQVNVVGRIPTLQ